MERAFGSTLSELRHARDLSQRKLAGDLHISQALLSHYENGTREPGLSFVCRVCDYFGVSADYLLGRSIEESGGAGLSAAQAALVYAIAERGGPELHEAALKYLDCAAERMLLYLDAHDNGATLAEQAVALAQAELDAAQAAQYSRAQ